MSAAAAISPKMWTIRRLGTGRRRLLFRHADGSRPDASRDEARRVYDLVSSLSARCEGNPSALLSPAIVLDRSDPKLVHLDGLNLSRAWCMRGIASALPSQEIARAVLSAAAEKHATAALAHVASGDYAGEHWLASFAVFLSPTP